MATKQDSNQTSKGREVQGFFFMGELVSPDELAIVSIPSQRGVGSSCHGGIRWRRTGLRPRHVAWTGKELSGPKRIDLFDLCCFLCVVNL